MDPIYEQLENSCDCFDCMDGNFSDATWKRSVDQLIHLVSAMACWQNETCESFLTGKRTEVFDAEAVNMCCCRCETGIYEFVPFYNQGIDPESVTAFLIVQNGVMDEVIELPASEVAYSNAFDVIRVNYQPFIPAEIRCGCPEKMKLVVTYNAGYDLIPECLLPIFCDMLRILYRKNDCSCDRCRECTEGEGDAGAYAVGADGEIPFDLQRHLKVRIGRAFVGGLGVISLCYKKAADRIWGVVV